MFHNPEDIKDDFLVAGHSIKKIIYEKSHPDFIVNEIENLLRQKEASMMEIVSTLDSASIFLYERGQFNMVRVLSERAIPYCKKADDKNTLFSCFRRVADCYYLINDDFADFTDNAIEYYNNALKVAIELNDKKLQDLCRSNLETIKKNPKQDVGELYRKC